MGSGSHGVYATLRYGKAAVDPQLIKYGASFMGGDVGVNIDAHYDPHDLLVIDNAGVLANSKHQIKFYVRS
jgi:hypothetical protein